MDYNEKTGEFEKPITERIGFWIGYVFWWVQKLAITAAVIWSLWQISRWMIGESKNEKIETQTEERAKVRE